MKPTVWEDHLAHPDHWLPGPRKRTRGIVWHATSGGGTNAGQYQAAIGWFQTPAHRRNPVSWSSAHVVFSWDGSRGNRSVPLDAIAYHVATPGINTEWLGAELSRALPLGAEPPWPEELWIRAGQWAAEMGARFGFDAADPACHRTHAQVQPADRTDPGPWFRLDALLEGVRRSR